MVIGLNRIQHIYFFLIYAYSISFIHCDLGPTKVVASPVTRIVGFGRIAVEPSTHILAALGVHGSGDLIVALGPRKHKRYFSCRVPVSRLDRIHRTCIGFVRPIHGAI